MADAGDLFLLCEETLTASVFALDTLPALGLDGAPDRAYVSPGEPAFDNCCEGGGQLTVYAANVTALPAGAGRTDRSGRKNIVGLVITSVRCVPTGELSGQKVIPPTIAQLQASAAQIDADGWALWNILWNLWRAGDLFSTCESVFWDGMRSIPPSGGCGGWNLLIRATLGGYDDLLTS